MIIGAQGFRPNHEGEALSRKAKGLIRWKPGTRQQAKRRFWKSERNKTKQNVKDDLRQT